MLMSPLPGIYRENRAFQQRPRPEGFVFILPAVLLAATMRAFVLLTPYGMGALMAW